MRRRRRRCSGSPSSSASLPLRVVWVRDCSGSPPGPAPVLHPPGGEGVQAWTVVVVVEGTSLALHVLLPHPGVLLPHPAHHHVLLPHPAHHRGLKPPARHARLLPTPVQIAGCVKLGRGGGGSGSHPPCTPCTLYYTPPAYHVSCPCTTMHFVLPPPCISCTVHHALHPPLHIMHRALHTPLGAMGCYVPCHAVLGAMPCGARSHAMRC